MRFVWRHVTAGVCATVLVAVSGIGHAQEQAPDSEVVGDDPTLYSCGKAKGKIAIRFKPEVQLKDLIAWAMGFTCKNFIYAAGIGGRSSKVTIVTPQTLHPRQAWDVFLVALQSMGLTVVKKGAVLELVEMPQVAGHPLTLHRKTTPASQEMGRYIWRPAHISALAAATAFEALKSSHGAVTPLAEAGVVVVTDFGSHIKLMKTLMAEIDQPAPGETIYAIRAHNVDAGELAPKLVDLIGAPAAPRSASRPSRTPASKAPRADRTPRQDTAVPSKIVADERTNTLFVLGSEAAYLRVKALVARLDVDLGDEHTSHVYLFGLQNANAESMANTLNALVRGSAARGPERPSPTRPSGTKAPSARPTHGSGSVTLDGAVHIAFDAPTNALLMIASPRDYLALRQIIQELDAPRQQVYIEAVILDLQTDRSRDLGVAFHGGSTYQDNLLIGGLQHENLSSINPSLGLGGVTGGLLGPLLSPSQFLGHSIPSLGVMIQALAGASTVDVLSTPHLLTADNEPAKISVGENIPYKSGQSQFVNAADTQSLLLPQTVSIERRDVALTLEVTPHVNNAGIIRMEISLEISSVKPSNGQLDTLGPSWTTRTLSNVVMVRDQESVVLGGLMADSATFSESKIPLLGDIPLLGFLFRSTSRSNAKANLLIILTPHVLGDEFEIREVLDQRMRERHEFLTALDRLADSKYQARIDYRRKRGLLAEINRVVARYERDSETLRELAVERSLPPDGPVESAATAQPATRVAAPPGAAQSP